jgi:histone methylation protein DOT1
MKMNKTTLFAWASYDNDVLFQHYLDIVYDNINEKCQEVPRKGRFVSESNGEIFYSSINKLLSKLVFKEEDVFVDLGSGRGKMVLHVYLQTAVKAVYGIELLTDLHAKAVLAANKVRQDLSGFGPKRQLIFLCGDFFKIDFQMATIVFINAICFGQDILMQLGQIINTIPSIHTVITLRPIDNLKQLFFKTAFCVEGSWDSALCYIYQK